MKKYFGIVSCLFLLSACDDGDLTFDSFDFSTATAKRCTTNPDILNSVFKLNDNEALLIKFPTDVFPFKNLEGTSGLSITAQNKIIYRVFNGSVSDDYFCSEIPPISPTVIDEWATANESSGNIEIKTTPVSNTTTRLDAKYDHVITFKNITLSNTSSNATVIYTEYIFGKYQTDSNIKFAFSATAIQNCSGGKLFKIADSNPGSITFKQNLNEVLILDLPPTVFQVAPGSKTYLVDDTHQLTYRIYGGDVTPTALCSTNGVGLPALYEEWQGEDGTPNNGTTTATGEIIIETAADGANLVHTITLRKIKYKRIGTTNNTIVEEFITFGNYTTTN